MVSIESIVFLLFKYIFVKVIFLFLWGNLPQLIPNKLILLIAYILGCSGASPTLAPCPLCCARAAGRGSPMGSSVLGIGLCSAIDWGEGHSGHSPHLPLVLSLLRAKEEQPSASRAKPAWVGPSICCTGSSRQEWAPAGSTSAQSPWSVPHPHARGLTTGLGQEWELCLCRAGRAPPTRPPPTARRCPS